MKRALVVYASATGCTRGVAAQIAETVRCAGAEVDLRPVQDAPDPRGYDAVIVGSGVRVSQWRKPMRQWVAAHAGTLATRPVAFFTVGLILQMFPEKVDEVRAYTDPLIEQTGVHPVDVGLFTGWNQPDQFGRAERLMIRAMRAPVGDFRDLAAVTRWTASVGPCLGLAEPAATAATGQDLP